MKKVVALRKVDDRAVEVVAVVVVVVDVEVGDWKTGFKINHRK